MIRKLLPRDYGIRACKREWNTSACTKFAYMHPNEDNAALSALALLFSTKLDICKLIRLLASIPLKSLMVRWKATSQGYNGARFRLESFWNYDRKLLSSYA